MEQISVILAHPYEKSLNAAIANAAVEKLQNSGYEVKFHDLYKEKFNPILSGAELVSDESDDELFQLHINVRKRVLTIVPQLHKIVINRNSPNNK